MSNSILKYFKPKPSPKVEKKPGKVAELGGSGDDGVEVATVGEDDAAGITSLKRDVLFIDLMIQNQNHRDLHAAWAIYGV